jgi:aminoglycoside phosphotransferase (APT) family kinase protein
VEWGAEAYVDEELARELIASQFAPLPRRSVSLLSEGWDYVVHRVDDDWAFRFPRRAVVVPGTERELAVLPLLGDRLPVAVPVPVHVGRPDERFPWPFYGAPFIPGVEANDAQLSDDDRTRMARPLARALRALHAPATYAVVGAVLPADPIRRADMGARVPRTREAIEGVVALGLWRPPPLVETILEQALLLPPAEPSAICHGDLHFRQLLVDRSELSGIIDWVDVCRSDPGVDLQIVWSFLAPAGRAVFRDEYGPVSEESLLRARVLALFLSATLARYGHAEGLLTVQTEALAGLRRTLENV